jgi:hypothetical protein
MTKQFISLAILMTVSAAAIGSAKANEITSFSVKPVSGFDKAPEISVYSNNGESYNAVDKTESTRATIKAKMKCRFGNNFRNADKAYEAKLDVVGMVPAGATQPDYGTALWSIGKDGNGDVYRSFRWGSTAGNGIIDPAKICNSEVQKRLSEQPDKTKYHIMAKGFTVNQPAALSARLTFTCNPTGGGFTDMETKATAINARIICQSSALAEKKIPKPKKPKRAQIVVPSVWSIDFKSDRENFRGTCPTTVTFTGSIRAGKKGEVSYRFVNLKDPSKSSGTYTLYFPKPETKQTIAWKRTINLPAANTSALAGGAVKGGDTLLQEYGTYRLDVEGADGKVLSKTADYNVECIKPKVMKVIPLKSDTKIKDKDNKPQ